MVYFFVVLGFGSRALSLLGKLSATEVQPRSHLATVDGYKGYYFKSMLLCILL